MSISQLNSSLVMAALVVVVILLFTVVYLAIQVRSLRSKWAEIVKGASGASLEQQLEAHFIERREMQRQLDATMRRVDELEAKMETSKRHVGVVRYDAFDDVGGSQSFAFAIYDDRGDGAVITSLVGRADCRVYGKPLSRGRSDRTLSEEEQRAIEEAQRQSPRPIIAP
jgi:hypothetical protein